MSHGYDFQFPIILCHEWLVGISPKCSSEPNHHPSSISKVAGPADAFKEKTLQVAVASVAVLTCASAQWGGQWQTWSCHPWCRQWRSRLHPIRVFHISCCVDLSVPPTISLHGPGGPPFALSIEPSWCQLVPVCWFLVITTSLGTMLC